MSKYIIKDFRPINIMNGMVKIISKVISRRLTKKLDNLLIAPTQSTFIQGRNMVDNFMVANDVNTQASKGKHGGIIHKIDFEKSFDHVEWSFLLRSAPVGKGIR